MTSLCHSYVITEPGGGGTDNLIPKPELFLPYPALEALGGKEQWNDSAEIPVSLSKRFYSWWKQALQKNKKDLNPISYCGATYLLLIAGNLLQLVKALKRLTGWWQSYSPCLCLSSFRTQKTRYYSVVLLIILVHTSDMSMKWSFQGQRHSLMV